MPATGLPGVGQVGRGPAGAGTGLRNNRSRAAFAVSVLEAMHAPTTVDNVEAILAQMQAEEPPGTSAGNNPLNIEVGTAQAEGYGNVGSWSIAPQIAVFPTWAEGARATAQEYENVGAGSAFRSGKASIAQLAQAISPWIGSDPSAQATYASHIQADVSGGVSAANANVPGAGAGYSGSSKLTGPLNLGQGTFSKVANGVTSLPSAISSAASGFMDWGLRVGKILLGVVLLLAAIFVAVKS